MRYQILYTVVVPSLILVMEYFTSNAHFYICAETIKSRTTLGLPELNSFIFIFILISRIGLLLNFRCKNAAAWGTVLKKKEFFVIFCFVMGLIILPYLNCNIGHFLQITPLSIGNLILAILLGIGTISLRLLNAGLGVLKDSKGFKLESEREMQRLDFTADFD
mmetsp:Transcript_5839/g.5007  ORF Transcript_5839/g.5007 Transcript_5839/m.5007 type:complete len:163 (+) Transcript_5839:2212-2700(+)